MNPNDALAMSVIAQIRRGDVSGSSFGFTVDPDDERWTYEPGKTEPLRTIYRATLFDVSPVTFPAYPQTTVTARTLP
jgi:HK97 family phage prohead protease